MWTYYWIFLAVCIIWWVFVMIALILKRRKDMKKLGSADSGLDEYRRMLNEEDIRTRVKHVFGIMLALSVLSLFCGIIALAINEIAWSFVAFISFLFDLFIAIIALKAKKNPHRYSKYFFNLNGDVLIDKYNETNLH